ncbi:LysR family transcriptional regulator [Enterococcus hulanensis]|uniref:LysR family transcriptional regulator n=1 Tax=Enterococcus hulanensis TaxID=2559929 RepID=A0ABU3F5I9_9ENTE|nr:MULTISPECIES: LysR family transcriptional regulator [Enterococcus]MBX8935660.1 LysR family transcriptional regulator [Enterococcus gilvus]MDT2602405.1 LysR family transcriptional regulator [Enterococcus hulanensis]MDT2611790.1 LysR family transcriptional regulator [Enterococcus hulanensis]MDT2618974.1 LysR family transcriptional regulator [Enterococcus hulanensis]MDT2630477.1 LysR family transcriptional regulator [Enterococcus hulanensis]
MNFKDLEYFQRLVREKSFTKVANAFHVSQPTITYAVKRLEDELGAELVYRDQSHKQLIITQAGIVLSRHISNILKEVTIAVTEIDRLKEDTLDFGLPPIIGNFYFPKLSSYLFKNDLMSHIHLVDGGSRDLYGLLRRGKIDLALLGSTQPIRDDDLTSEILIEKRFMIVVSPNHPLAKRKEISFSELKDEPFVLLNEHYVHPTAFKKMAQQAHFEPQIIYQNSNLNILKGMIREQIGIGFLAELAISPEDNLVMIPITDQPQPTFMISLVQREQVLDSTLRGQLIELIRGFSQQKEQ